MLLLYPNSLFHMVDFCLFVLIYLFGCAGSYLWHVGSSSLTQGTEPGSPGIEPQAPYISSAESYLLDHHRSPHSSFQKHNSDYVTLLDDSPLFLDKDETPQHGLEFLPGLVLPSSFLSHIHLLFSLHFIKWSMFLLCSGLRHMLFLLLRIVFFPFSFI